MVSNGFLWPASGLFLRNNPTADTSNSPEATTHDPFAARADGDPHIRGNAPAVRSCGDFCLHPPTVRAAFSAVVLVSFILGLQRLDPDSVLPDGWLPDAYSGFGREPIFPDRSCLVFLGQVTHVAFSAFIVGPLLAWKPGRNGQDDMDPSAKEHATEWPPEGYGKEVGGRVKSVRGRILLASAGGQHRFDNAKR
jgi:hypothetical protein